MAENEKEEEYYLTRPTTQIDLEQRFEAMRAQEEGEEPEGEPGRDYAVEDNDTSAYIAVDAEYMTYADDTHKPLMADEGVEQEAEKRALSGLHPNSVVAANSGSVAKEMAEEGEAERSEKIESAEKSRTSGGETSGGDEGGGLQDKNKDELMQMAAEQNIEGRSSMTKDELVTALEGGGGGQQEEPQRRVPAKG